MSNRVVVVAGQSGCGKDYLVSRANVHPNVVNHIGWGSLFAAIVGEDRDSISYKPTEDRTYRIQRMVVRQVLEMQPAIVTSHPVKIDGDGEYVNWEIESELSPTSYIFVTAPPELIADRLFERNRYGTRQSPIPTVDTIARQQERKLELVTELGAYVGVPLFVVHNTPDNFSDSVQLIAKQIEAINR